MKRQSRSAKASEPSPAAETSTSDASDWEENCAVCGADGDLICCEFGKSCKLSYHLRCVGLDAVPDGTWICPRHNSAAGAPISHPIPALQPTSSNAKKTNKKAAAPAGRANLSARESRSTTPQPVPLVDHSSENESQGSQGAPPLSTRLRKRKPSTTNAESSNVDADATESSDDNGTNVAEKLQNKRTTAGSKRRSSAPCPAPEDDDCSRCGRGGELLCCETAGCNRGFHLHCVGLTSVPQGSWECPVHTDPNYPIYVRPPPSKKKQCQCCAAMFEVILTSPLSNQHETMLNYSLCSSCLDQLTPEFKAKNDEIEAFIVSSSNKGSLKERKYFVKWKGLNHRKCSWISRVEAVWAGRTKLNRFDQKMDEMSPSDFQELLKTRGLESDWVDIDRIVDEDTEDSEDVRVLVKWKGLGYDCATWESLSSLSADERLLYDAYKVRMNDNTDIKVKEPAKKKFAIFDVQPEFLTGGTLHAYQLEGLNWLRFQYSKGTNAILADEMGLGKTVQVVSYAASLAKSAMHATRRPILIVAPLSCIAWWVREFNRWAPFLDCLALTGRETSRAAFWSYEVFPSTGKRNKNRALFDVLVTSFEIARIDVTELKRLSWDVIAIDEGHRLKNSSSALLDALIQLESQHRVVITGTPLQNNLAELMNLMQFVDENVYRKLKSSHIDSDLKNPSSDQIRLFQESLGPFLLRRMKADVRDAVKIPPKFEVIVTLDLSKKQRSSYKGVLQRSRALLVNGKANALSNIVMSLRNVCNHNFLIEDSYTDRPALEDLLDSSSKLQFLDQFIPVLRDSGRRILIFSQFVTMLDIISQYLHLKGISFGRIDGTIPSGQRQKSIDAFNAPSSEQYIFLLSTRAGGLGLNLASADTVVMYDSDWNPHADLQALSRCHRIGQAKIVMIYRLVCKFSVEERIVMVGKKKLALEHAVVSGLSKKEKESDGDGKPTKDELLQILQAGAEQLFGERSGEMEKQPRIWDAVGAKKLLDQSLSDAAEAAAVEEKSVAATEEDGFFAAFKHAKIWSFDEQELGNLDSTVQGSELPVTSVSSADFWSRILPEEAPVLEEVLPVNEAGYSMRKRKAVDYRGNMSIFGNVFVDQEVMKVGVSHVSDSGDAKHSASDGESGDEEGSGLKPDTKTVQKVGTKVVGKRSRSAVKPEPGIISFGKQTIHLLPAQAHAIFFKGPDFICMYQSLQQNIPQFECCEQFCDQQTPWDTPAIVLSLNKVLGMDIPSLYQDTMSWLNFIQRRFNVSSTDIGNRLYGHNPESLTNFGIWFSGKSALPSNVSWMICQGVRSYIGGFLSCCTHGGLPPYNVHSYAENLSLFQTRLTSSRNQLQLHAEASLMIKFSQSKLVLLDTLAWMKFTCDQWRITQEQLLSETGIDPPTFKLVIDNFSTSNSRISHAIGLLRSCLNAINHFKCLPSKALRSFSTEVCHFCRQPLRAYKIRCSNARGILDVCATCCRKANHPDPVQNVQIFTNYGTFVLNGFDEFGLGEILRNINVPLSRFVDCSITYKRLYLLDAHDPPQQSTAIRVRFQSRILGFSVDSRCTPQILKLRLTAKSSVKDTDKLYRLYLNGNPLQDNIPISQQGAVSGSVIDAILSPNVPQLYYVRVNGNVTFSLMIPPIQSVNVIKNSIAASIGVSPTQLHLTSKGRRLDTRHSLLNLGIEPGSWLDCVVVPLAFSAASSHGMDPGRTLPRALAHAIAAHQLAVQRVHGESSPPTTPIEQPSNPIVID